jgi:hypothetical protein
MTAEPIDKAIDPARVGLSKSLMTSPCHRKGFYQETVRDEKGWRLRFPMPEKVLMGSAVDSAHSYIAWHLREGRPWTRDAAVREGLKRADEQSWALLSDEDEEIFHRQLDNAIHLFMISPDGLERFRAEIDGIRIQGNDGESLRADDVIGTPDYLLADGSVLDVKCAGQRYSEAKFWRSPEMPVYAYLAASEAGVIPPRLIYQVYVRVGKPYWQYLEIPGTPALVELGKQHAAHWRKALAIGDPDAFAVNPTFCGDCSFRKPIPEVGFEGCAVGLLMPDTQDEAA